MVRVTKGLGGDVSALVGENLADAPWDLVSAINQALIVLSWYENLSSDEQPPRWIWHSTKLIDEWFKEVRRAREKGTKVSSYERAEDRPMSSNSLADDLRPVFVDG